MGAFDQHAGARSVGDNATRPLGGRFSEWLDAIVDELPTETEASGRIATAPLPRRTNDTQPMPIELPSLVKTEHDAGAEEKATGSSPPPGPPSSAPPRPPVPVEIRPDPRQDALLEELSSYPRPLVAVETSESRGLIAATRTVTTVLPPAASVHQDAEEHSIIIPDSLPGESAPSESSSRQVPTVAVPRARNSIDATAQSKAPEEASRSRKTVLLLALLLFGVVVIAGIILVGRPSSRVPTAGEVPATPSGIAEPALSSPAKSDKDIPPSPVSSVASHPPAVSESASVQATNVRPPEKPAVSTPPVIASTAPRPAASQRTKPVDTNIAEKLKIEKE